MTKAAGKVGKNQVNASTKTPGQQPNKNPASTSPSITPTQNPSTPGKVNPNQVNPSPKAEAITPKSSDATKTNIPKTKERSDAKH